MKHYTVYRSDEIGIYYNYAIRSERKVKRKGKKKMFDYMWVNIENKIKSQMKKKLSFCYLHKVFSL